MAIVESDVRAVLTTYLLQASRNAQIQWLPHDHRCQQLITVVVDMVLASNAGIARHIVQNVNSFPERKRSVRWKGWRGLLRKAAYAYADGLYHELDLAEAYMEHPGLPLECSKVLAYRGCLEAACRRAAALAHARSRLYGWVYFRAA